MAPELRVHKYQVRNTRNMAKPPANRTQWTTSTKTSRLIRVVFSRFTISSFNKIPSSTQTIGTRVVFTFSVTPTPGIGRMNMLNCARLWPTNGLPVF